MGSPREDAAIPSAPQIINAISQTFGRSIWRRTLLALTHAHLPQTPPGTTYGAQTGGSHTALVLLAEQQGLEPPHGSASGARLHSTARAKGVPQCAPAAAAPCCCADSFADGRIRQLRRAVRGLLFRPALPAVLVENSDACPRSPDSGNRVLPDGTEWMVSTARLPGSRHRCLTKRSSATGPVRCWGHFAAAPAAGGSHE